MYSFDNDVACIVCYDVAYAVAYVVAFEFLLELSISVFLYSHIRQLGLKAFLVLFSIHRAKTYLFQGHVLPKVSKIDLAKGELYDAARRAIHESDGWHLELLSICGRSVSSNMSSP